MASEQVFRKETTTIEKRGVPVEKDRVEKMTSHFEALAEQAKDSDITGDKENPLETGKDAAGWVKVIGQIGVGGRGRETRETETQLTGSRGAPSEEAKETSAGDGKATGQIGVGGTGREMHETGTQFESLSDKVRGVDISGSEKEDRQRQSHADKGRAKAAHEGGDRDSQTVGKFEFSDGTGERGLDEARTGEGKEQGGVQRGTAQQRPTDVATYAEEQHEKAEQQASKIAAEERYAQAKLSEAQEKEATKPSERRQEKGSVGEEHAEGKGSTEAEEMEQYFTAETGGGVKETTREMGQQGYAASRTGQAREYAQKEVLPAVTERARQAKDVAVEKGQQGYATAKDTLLSTARTATEKTEQAAEYAQKEVLPTVTDKAAAAKDAAVDLTKSAASYTGEKAVEAKDVTVETGKSAAGYAGNVAVDVKDRAVAVGWTAAHKSAEMAVAGTKSAAKAVQGVAGYAGEKAAAATHMAADLASKPVGTAKDVAISTGERVKEYTAKKEDQAWREVEQKKSHDQGQGGRDGGGLVEETVQKGRDVGRKAVEKVGDTVEKGKDAGRRAMETTETKGREVLGRGAEGGEGEGLGGQEIMGAIGETIVEIAQTGKDMVVGEDQAVACQAESKSETKNERQ